MHQKKDNNDSISLSSLVSHIVTDYKLEIVTQQKRQIMRQLQDPELMRDTQRYLEVMTQYKDIKEIEKKLSQQEGRVIV